MSMSPTPTIDEQVKQITDSAFHGASSREIAIALEANQAYIEYLDWLKDNLSVDGSVIVETGGTRIRFNNEDDFSNWLAEQIK